MANTTLKSLAEMEKRLSELEGLRTKADLTLSTAGELDAIRQGLNAWNEYRQKHYAR